MPIDDPHDVSYERWLARQIVRMHTEAADPNRASRQCAQCGPDGGCRQLTWASAVVAVETPPLRQPKA